MFGGQISIFQYIIIVWRNRGYIKINQISIISIISLGTANTMRIMAGIAGGYFGVIFPDDFMCDFNNIYIMALIT